MENKQNFKKEKVDQKSESLLNLETMKKKALAPFMITINEAGWMKDKKGYVIKKEWGGAGVKKDDLEKVTEIENRYEKQKNYIINGESILKKIDDKLSKIRKNETITISRSNELLKSGLEENQANKIAELEDKIRCDKERASLLLESMEISNFVDKKIKDVNKRLEQAQKNIETDSKLLDNLTGEEQKIPIDINDDENKKSKSQLLRDAGEELRSIKLDVIFIEQTKQDLINQKYKTEDAEKISILIAEIFADEKRIEILKQNPKIQNGLRELKKIEKNLGENINKRDSLLSNSEKVIDPEPENNIVSEKGKKNFWNFLVNKKGRILNDNEKQAQGVSNTFPPFSYIPENNKSEVSQNTENNTKNNKAPIDQEKTPSPKILNTFPPYAAIQLTPSEAKAQEIKEDIENAENERIKNITIDELINKIGTRETEAKIKLENSKEFGARITRGLDKWEKFGQGETGPKGFAKRMSKNAINLALVGIISSVAVDQLAEAGIGSVTALGGGVTSNILRKVSMGLGFGVVFEAVNSIKSDNKYIDGVKKALPYLISIGAIGVGVVSGAGAVGAVSALGILASKIFKSVYTKEKIEARQEKSKEKLIAEIKENGETISLSDLDNFEKRMDKIIKKYEKQRIYGRVIDGLTKLTIASTVSTIVLEASGITKDHLHQQDLNDQHSGGESVSGQKITEEDISKWKKDMEEIQEKQNHTGETEMEKIVRPETPNTSNEINNPNNENPTEVENNLATDSGENKTEANNEAQIKGEGITIKNLTQESSTKMAIELGMYNPGSENESMIVQSGTIAFDDGHGNTVEVDYSEKGAIQTMVDLKEALSEKFGSVDKIPEGTLSTHYIDMDGVTHDQNLMGTNTNGETVIDEYKGKMFDSDNSEIKIDTTPHVDNNNLYNVPEQINPETGEVIDLSNIQETPHIENSSDSIYQEEPKINKLNADTENNDTPMDQKQSADNIIQNELTQVQLDEIHKVFDNNIDHLFSERPGSSWNYIQNHVSAERIMEMSRNNEIKPDFEPLVEHLKDLQKVTGVHPQGPEYGLGGIVTKEAETIPHFMGRAIEEAYKKGIINQVKL